MNTIEAIIKGTASKEMTKSNGAKYVLINCMITSGPAEGLVVAGTFTTLTAEGVEKEVPAPETEVILYREVLPSTKEAGKFVNFFNIGLGYTQADNDLLNSLLGVPAEVSKQTI